MRYNINILLKKEVITMPAKKKTETAPVAEVKAETAAPVEEAKPVAEKKPDEKKAVRKPAAKKAAPAKNTAAKKAPAKKAEPKVTVKVQFSGNEYDIDEITKNVAKAYKGSVKGAVKSVDIYVKPEDGAVYYVVNSEVSDKIDL